MWIALKSREACLRCSRYARTTRLLQRATSLVFDDLLGRAGILIPGFGDRVAEVLGKRRLVGLNLSVATCPSCHRSWIRPAAVGMDGAHPVVRPIVAYELSPAQATELYRIAS